MKYMNCPCGSNVLSKYYLIHMRSKKHMKYEKSNNFVTGGTGSFIVSFQ